jgi:hypothetical protein
MPNYNIGIQFSTFAYILEFMRAIHQASSEPAAKLAKGPVTIEAEPYEFMLLPEHCALLIIDMQRDFLEPGGFGAMLGDDVSQLRRTIEPNKRLDGRPDSSFPYATASAGRQARSLRSDQGIADWRAANP